MNTLRQYGTVFTLCVMILVFSVGDIEARVDSKGTEYNLVFMPNYRGVGNLSVYISSEMEAHGVVEIPGLNFTQSFSISGNELTKIDLPATAQRLGSNDIQSYGVHIVSDNDISVYGLNRRQYTTDAYMALPVDTLGLEYISMSYYALSQYSYPSQVAIVGVYDNTEVTITPSNNSSGNSAGIPFSITLNRLETYYMSSSMDLTGSIIKATAPIGVMAGVECAYVPRNVSACDHIVEMMPPVSTWGKSFLTVPLATRLKGDIFRILASQDNTVVRVNGTDAAVLERGKFYETILTSESQIEASEPVLVAQYSVGQSYDWVVSDPFMMLVPPTEQFLDNYIFTSLDGFPRNYVNVVIPTAYTNTIMLDGSAVDPAAFTQIGGSGFSGAQIPVATGSHSISGSTPFGIYVYGFGSYDSYGYPGGMSFDLINPQGDQYPPNLKLIQAGDVFNGIAEDSEDININGILETSEDINGNGIIDRRTEDLNNNDILDPDEDTNGDGLLDRDSGIYKVELEADSENLQLQLSNFVPGSIRAEFTITRIDISIPGKGALIVSDGVGNTVTRQITIAGKKSLTNVRLVSTLSTDRIDLDDSSFSVIPTSVSSINGATVIEWHFDQLYVDQIENIQYDAVLHDPKPAEKRVVTQKMDLYYLDVNGNEVHSGMGQTYVDVLPSIVKIDVATDKPSYTANEQVLIDAVYTNLSEYDSPLDVRLTLRDNKGVVAAVLLELDNVDVAAGETWKPSNLALSTDNLYEGLYEVRAELLDDSGQTAIYTSTPFLVVPSADITVAARISTDKYLYDPFEAATLHDRISNTTSNTILEGLSVTTTVYAPVGSAFWSQTGSLPQVLPGSSTDLNYSLQLARALPGKYQVLLVVKDSQGVERALTETEFEVGSSADSGAGLSGDITSIPGDGHVLKTEYLHLTANVENLGNAGIENLPISLSLIDPVNQQVIAQWDNVIGSLSMQSTYAMDEDWRAMAPVGSTYVAVLTATIGDEQKVLASKNVTINEKIKSTFNKGVFGRLLVLLDEDSVCKDHKHKDGNGKDVIQKEMERCRRDDSHHGDKDEPTLTDQRTFLEARLKENGWSYTIVTDRDDFANEMRSNGYVAYALLSEREKLDEHIQHELRERIFRGEGLLVSGIHDERNGRLDSALGIKFNGNYSRVGSFIFRDSPLALQEGEQVLAYREDTVRIELAGAEVAAMFDFNNDRHKPGNQVIGAVQNSRNEDKGNHHKDRKAAVTTYQFGLGHSVYAAFDLLAQATASRDANLLDDLLTAGLAYSHPQDLNTIQTNVIPIRLALTNVGASVAGRVLITLPEGVQWADPGMAAMDQNESLIWVYELGTDESSQLDFWVRFLEASTDLTFNAAIQIGQEPNWEDYGADDLVVRPGVYPGLYDAINELSSLLHQDWHYRSALKELQHAERSLQHNRVAGAINHMLKATDALSKAKHGRSDDIRVMIDNAIVLYAQQLQTHNRDHDDGRRH